MNTDRMLKVADSLLAAWALKTNSPEANRLDVTLDAANLLPAVQALTQPYWGYLAGITGLDPGIETGQLEVLYHFCAGAAVVTLRVTLPREGASVPTVCDLVPAANFYERELHEMLGVEVVGMTNLQHLFLPDDWQEGVYPLRKDAILP